ncbi:hypothetical protein Q3G72_006265 [Acer saccharum]|nr:hypothetical protein Q3G72_006265 [Acer saccharum]
MTALHISKQNRRRCTSSLLYVALPAPCRHRLRLCIVVVVVADVVARRRSTSKPRHSTSVFVRRCSTFICLFLNCVVDEVADELGFGDWRWMVVWLWADDEDDDGG